VLKNRIHHDAERIDETFRVGVEIEACLIDKNGMPVNAEPLIKENQGTMGMFLFTTIVLSKQ
jgi:hypothetical protein